MLDMRYKEHSSELKFIDAGEQVPTFICSCKLVLQMHYSLGTNSKSFRSVCIMHFQGRQIKSLLKQQFRLHC